MSSAPAGSGLTATQQDEHGQSHVQNGSVSFTFTFTFTFTMGTADQQRRKRTTLHWSSVPRRIPHAAKPLHPFSGIAAPKPHRNRQSKNPSWTLNLPDAFCAPAAKADLARRVRALKQAPKPNPLERILFDRAGVTFGRFMKLEAKDGF